MPDIEDLDHPIVLEDLKRDPERIDHQEPISVEIFASLIRRIHISRSTSATASVTAARLTADIQRSVSVSRAERFQITV
jgi:hypothetical protein